MTQKYEFTARLHNLYQIRALVDIPRHNVKAGDLGGLISATHNLSHQGDCWLDKTSIITDDARVEGNAIVRDSSRINGQAYISGNATIDFCNVWHDVNVTDNAVVSECSLNHGTVIQDNVHIHNLCLKGRCLLKGNTKIIIPRGPYQTLINIQGELTDKDFLVQGPALSSGRYSLGVKTPNGVDVSTGCFYGTLDEYIQAIEETHADDPGYLNQYRRFHQNFIEHFSQ